MNSQEGPYGPASINTVDSLNPLLPASWSSDRFAKVCSVVTRDISVSTMEPAVVDSKMLCEIDFQNHLSIPGSQSSKDLQPVGFPPLDLKYRNMLK